MKTRLSMTSRGRIVSKLMNHTFDLKDKEFLTEENTLALCVYYYFFPNELKFLPKQPQMKTLPDGWLPESNSILCTAGGYRAALSFDSKMRFPDSNRYHYYENYIVQDGLLVSSIQDLLNRKQKLVEEKQIFRSKLHGFISRFQYVENLYIEMPDLPEILGANFFGVAVVQSTALTITAKEIICKIAQVREEPRDDCCNGEPIKV